jgi:hypothetical protein
MEPKDLLEVLNTRNKEDIKFTTSILAENETLRIQIIEDAMRLDMWGDIESLLLVSQDVDVNNYVIIMETFNELFPEYRTIVYKELLKTRIT